MLSTAPRASLVILAVFASNVAGLQLPAAARPSRREICALLPLAPLILAPQRCNAKCTCPSGLNSCICTDDEPESSPKSKSPTIKKKRVDAAARDLEDSKQERDAFDAFAASTANGKTPVKNPGPGSPAQARGPTPGTQAPPQQAQALGLSGGGSQNAGEVDVAGAKARFRAIVLQTAEVREREYGFELDAADIKQIENALRPKYCGPQGLIGPC